MPSNHCSNWEYHEWLKEENKGKKAKRVHCVVCGEETVWVEGMNVKYSDKYIDGYGELCAGCWRKTGGVVSPHPD